MFYDYYPLQFFFKPIFSLALIICLGIITPYIIILANKDKDYKNKKIFIIYEKAISILLMLHIILTLINFLITSIKLTLITSTNLILINPRITLIKFLIINFISKLIIGAVGIAIIYGICCILDKNNIVIYKKSYINKVFHTIGKIPYYIKNINIIETIIPILAPIVIPICSLIYIFATINNSIDLQSFSEIIDNIKNNNSSEYITPILLIIAIILVAIFCLFFILIFLVFMINSTVIIINSNLNN